MDNRRPSLSGPWGGSQASEWSYTPSCGCITLVTIGYNRTAIESLVFQSKDGKSKTFGGGSGQPPVSKVDITIDFPNEYITGISGYTNRIASLATPSVVVTSLNISTNLKEYGPFGPESGDAFTFRPEDNNLMITGFFGRADLYIDAIGVYYKYLDQGPWGGEYGQYFDDGKFANIKQILVYLVNEFVSGIRIEYVDENGNPIWLPLHGRTGDEKKVKIDPEEYLIGIEGFYGPADEGSHGSSQGSGGVVIKSLTFTKNNGTKIGPFGKQIGESFSSPVDKKSKVVGFFGWADTDKYLNAIGIHTEWLCI